MYLPTFGADVLVFVNTSIQVPIIFARSNDGNAVLNSAAFSVNKLILALLT